MKATTVYLSEEATLALEKLAQQLNRPASELIQDAIDRYLLNSHASLPPSIGLGASGSGDLSERDEELLWQESMS
ncbi:MAG: ribbon-helix-helix domain-containing protein [Stenomitos rutilans HA7619-LM2]|jgi:predicted transcriptional regulator|nr:ribbon-helix-helix domain-containing protein [Stenomitos rutilans HA7619-LM2]